MQSLFFCNRHDIFTGFFKRFCRIIRICRLFHEVFHGKRAGEPCRTSCGKRVIRPRVIITKCFRTISSQEYGACIPNQTQIIERMIYTEFQMFRCDFICRLDCTTNRRRYDYFTIPVNRGACNFLPRKRRDRPFQCFRNVTRNTAVAILSCSA